LIHLLLFIAIPVGELFFLIFLASKIGFLPTLAIVIVTGMLGIFLLKRQGKTIMAEVNTEMANGRLPSSQMAQGLLLLLAAVLLITPGVFTDVVGLMLMFPPLRRIAAAKVVRFFKSRMTVMNTGTVNFGQQSRGRVIDAEWEEEKDTK
jgi:UPF0716 protein FxsA